MNLNFIDIPVKLNVSPIIQPCSEVSWAIGKTGTKICWKSSNTKKKLSKTELKLFLKETEALMASHSNGYPNLIMKSSFDINYNAIEEYWKKWGPLIDSPTKELDILDFLMSCFSVLITINIWSKNFGMQDILINRFFESFNKFTKKYNPIKYWVFQPIPNINKAEWLPTIGKFNSTKTSFILKIKHPSNIKNILFDTESKTNFFHRAVLQSIAEYITKKQLPLKAVLSPGNMKYQIHFEAECSDKLLFCLLSNLPDSFQTFKYCKCGCGSIIYDKKRKYLPGHRDKEKNSKPNAIIKSRIRKKKNAGKISEEQKLSLYKIVDEMYEDGYEKHEINSNINDILKKWHI